MTLNGVMAVILRYLVEITKSVELRRRWRLCVRCRRKKFTFVISSPDELLALNLNDFFLQRLWFLRVTFAKLNLNNLNLNDVD